MNFEVLEVADGDVGIGWHEVLLPSSLSDTASTVAAAQQDEKAQALADACRIYRNAKQIHVKSVFEATSKATVQWLQQYPNGWRPGEPNAPSYFTAS